VQIDGNGKLSFPGKPSTEVNVSGEKSYDSEQGKTYAKLASDINDAGRNATPAIGTIRVMKRLIEDPNFYSGTGGQSATAIKKAMVALKVADANSAAPNELFGKMSNQMVLDSAGGSLGTGFSNADRDFIVAKTANIGNTPEGNKSILDLAEKVEQRKIEVSKFTRAWAKEHGGRLGPDFEDALQQWAEKNPAFPDAAKAAPQAPAPAAAFSRGQTATNPKTGEKMQFDGSQWVPLKVRPDA
jgi:hypothetical protein